MWEQIWYTCHICYSCKVLKETKEIVGKFTCQVADIIFVFPLCIHSDVWTNLPTNSVSNLLAYVLALLHIFVCEGVVKSLIIIIIIIVFNKN